MKLEDKGCYNHGPAPQETPMHHHSEFQKGKNAARVSSNHRHRITNGKPTPSKWDDAQKWLVGLSKGGGGGGEKSQSKTKPRNSNADDLRLIAPVPQKEQDYSSSEKEEEQEEHDVCHDFIITTTTTSDAETNKYVSEHTLVPVQSICFRDMGTEMTPIASQEPSRTATPIRATTPAARSPIHSGTSTPVKIGQNGLEGADQGHNGSVSSRGNNGGTVTRQCCGEGSEKKKIEDQARKLSPLESRAIAWDEAERAKFMARFKREEVKIQAWENHQIRKAEMEMKKMEVKAERMKALAQERFTNKLATTKRIAEEKKANAQVELKDQALKTTEKVEYIRRTGHVPSSFSCNFKLPSICW